MYSLNLQGGKLTDATVTSAKIDTLDMAKIVDSDGNYRFSSATWITGATYGTSWDTIRPSITYNKVAISGNHLMFVWAGTADSTQYPNGLTITNGTTLLTAGIPSWMGAKLYGWFSAGGYANIGVGRANLQYVNASGTMTTVALTLQKWSNTLFYLAFDFENTGTITISGGYRIQFDFIVE